MHPLARILSVRHLYYYNLLFWTGFCLLQAIHIYAYTISFGYEFHVYQLIRYPMASCLSYWILSHLVLNSYLATRKLRMRRFVLIHSAGSIAFGIIHKAMTYLIGLLLERLLLAHESLNWRELFVLWRHTYVDIANPIAMYGLLLGVLLALDYGQKFREQLWQAHQLQHQLTEAELHGLKTQLQPHFLFNALNTIAMMVRRNKSQEAITMITSLSEMLRNNLGKKKTQFVTLQEELALLSHYLTIEQARYQDKLHIDMQIAPETLHKPVPTLVLQPVVENAFKHGIAHALQAATLRITAYLQADRLILEVFNSSDLASPDWILARRKGIGLRNTTDRLLQLYQGKAKFQVQEMEFGVLVRITLPSAPESYRLAKKT